MFILSAQVYAATPVIDNVAISKMVSMLSELDKQLSQMQTHYEEALMQSGILTNQLSAMTGENLFSDIYNNTQVKDARVWAPNSIEEFEEMLKNGFNPSDFLDRYEYYLQKFPAIAMEQIEAKNPNSALRDLYGYTEEWTKMNLVGFAQTFDAVNSSYERINNLLSEINEHKTLKQSSDFTNRLLGELGYLLQSLIQVQNFSMHMNTMLQQATQTQISEHTKFFTFNRN